MNEAILVITHAAAAGAGALVCYYVVMATHDVQPSHPNRTDMRRAIAAPAVILVASLLVITIGVQAYLFQREQRNREEQFREQQKCLGAWGKELSDNLATNRQANADLRKAQDEKDAALDRVIVTVAKFRRVPPAATSQEVQSALETYVDAQASLALVRAQTAATLTSKPYRTPQEVCGP